MPEVTSAVVVGDGGVRLSVRLHDAPTPAAPGLLLHHGLASSQRIWDGVLPRLTRRFRVVTFDARGHGLSGKPNRGYGFAHVVADALAVARDTGLGRPIVVGHSWGAMVMLELAARHRRSVTGAVLVDGGLLRMRDELDWAAAKESLAPPNLPGMPLEEFRGVMRMFMADAVDVTPDVEAQMLSVMRVRRDGTIAPRLARSNHFRILRAIWEQNPDACGPGCRAHARDRRSRHRRRPRREVASGSSKGAGAHSWASGHGFMDAGHPRPASAASGRRRPPHRTLRAKRRRLGMGCWCSC